METAEERVVRLRKHQQSEAASHKKMLISLNPRLKNDGMSFTLQDGTLAWKQELTDGFYCWFCLMPDHTLHGPWRGILECAYFIVVNWPGICRVAFDETFDCGSRNAVFGESVTKDTEASKEGAGKVIQKPDPIKVSCDQKDSIYRVWSLKLGDADEFYVVGQHNYLTPGKRYASILGAREEINACRKLDTHWRPHFVSRNSTQLEPTYEDEDLINRLLITKILLEGWEDVI